MEVIQVLDRPASDVFYAVAGRLLFVESIGLKLRDLIIDLFAGWQLTSVSSPGRSPDIRISFSCEETLPSIPRDLNQFEIAEGGKCYTDGAGFHLALGNALVHLEDGSSISVQVTFSGLPGPGDPLLARAASFAVCAGLRRYGLFDLHSAGVVEPESGKGVVIVGPSGSGKSTLALQLAKSGWSYLSDDELLLNLADGGVEARGFRSFFAVSTAEVGARFKHCFEPEVEFGSKRVLHAAPGLLLFISLKGGSQSELGQLTQAETMKRLIRACPWATYDRSIAGANLELLSTLARQARGFDLSAGRDLLEPDFAARFLNEALTPS
ncbi:MAG TPA: hypothetical protein VKB05_07725 [Pyrinomonadaceae bacterium]|nr:hypothetical protein [Pyrinomonadaceae bacterium]